MKICYLFTGIHENLIIFKEYFYINCIIYCMLLAKVSRQFLKLWHLYRIFYENVTVPIVCFTWFL